MSCIRDNNDTTGARSNRNPQKWTESICPTLSQTVAAAEAECRRRSSAGGRRGWRDVRAASSRRLGGMCHYVDRTSRLVVIRPGGTSLAAAVYANRLLPAAVTDHKLAYLRCRCQPPSQRSTSSRAKTWYEFSRGTDWRLDNPLAFCARTAYLRVSRTSKLSRTRRMRHVFDRK